MILVTYNCAKCNRAFTFEPDDLPAETIFALHCPYCGRYKQLKEIGREEIIYRVSVEDIQLQAENDIERRLTPEEMEKVRPVVEKQMEYAWEPQSFGVSDAISEVVGRGKRLRKVGH